MRIDYLQQTQSKNGFMRWIIYGFILFVLLLFIYGFIIYNQIETKRSSGFMDAKDKVFSETSVTEIDTIERFHGNKAYYIVYGQTSNNEEKIVFVPFENNDQALITVNQADIIPKDSIITAWRKKCTDCRLTKITPGMFDDEYIWEIKYYDHSKRFVLEYVSLYDGTPYETFKFTHLFK